MVAAMNQPAIIAEARECRRLADADRYDLNAIVAKLRRDDMTVLCDQPNRTALRSASFEHSTPVTAGLSLRRCRHRQAGAGERRKRRDLVAHKA